MAALNDKYGRCSLEIVAVMPSVEGPRNAYYVTVREGAEAAFERQYTIWDGTPDGHWFVWRLFRALQLAETLAKQTTSFNVTGRRVKAFNEPATVSVSTGWLDMVLWADTLAHTRPEPTVEERCALTVYLLTGPQEQEAIVGQMRRFVFHCAPADVVRFGKDLEAECREALRLRRELSLTAPTDDYIDG